MFRTLKSWFATKWAFIRLALPHQTLAIHNIYLSMHTCIHCTQKDTCWSFFLHFISLSFSRLFHIVRFTWRTLLFLWPCCCCYCRICYYFYCIAFHFVCTVITKPMGNRVFCVARCWLWICRRRISMHVSVQFSYIQMEWKSSLKKWASTELQIISYLLIFSLWTVHLKSRSISLSLRSFYCSNELFLYKFGWMDVPLMVVHVFSIVALNKIYRRA